MAFLRFSRDKRGYEHFYLVQPPNRGKGRPRLLYWFRTPPNVKVGRAPFDPEIQRVLESHNPDVAFDWAAIVHTPIPPPVEVERWRERRRVERALRAAAGPDQPDQIEAEVEERGGEIDQAYARRAADVPVTARPEGIDAQPAVNTETASDETSAEAVALVTEAPQRRRRRRRRRGHGGREVQGAQQVHDGRETPRNGAVQEVEAVQLKGPNSEETDETVEPD